jgi:hypothetical protein
LPKDLPEWFARNDANADGQVAMAEFTASWSNSTAREFDQFDLNHDGLITAKECLDATKKGVVRGVSSSSSSTSVASTKSSDTGTSQSSTTSNAAAASSSSAAKPATPTPAIQIDGRMIAFSQQLIKKYDSNGDGTLTKNEWSSMSKDPSAADTDGDGKITPTEHAQWTASR